MRTVIAYFLSNNDEQVPLAVKDSDIPRQWGEGDGRSVELLAVGEVSGIKTEGDNR